MMRCKLLASCVLLALFVVADTYYPKNSLYDKADPIASENFVEGGSIVEYVGPSPKSLNYYLDGSVQSSRLFDLLFEPLISINSQTLEYDRCIASKWSISDDGSVFTFWIDPEARWSDGRKITAEDVVWTYNAVMDPKNMTGSAKVSLERLYPPEVLENGAAVRFKVRQVHWESLGAAGGFPILPKHVFDGQDFNKVNFEFPVVSGPYKIESFKEGFSLTLTRRKDWWRKNWASVRGSYNFQRVVNRYYNDRNNAFDAFLKGEIDVFAVYTASQWHQIEKRVKQVKNNWIVKQAVHNHAATGFQGFAMNMRRAPFDDVRVRKAMALLLDRPTMNRTLMYDQYFLHKSYWEDLYDKEHPCPNELTPFDPKAALKLLGEAGWKVNPTTGALEKNGKQFTFTFLTRDGTADKFLAIYDQALKAVGIKMEIRSKDWSAWMKDMEHFSFDMTWAAWGSGLFKDPESMWASAEAERVSGNNICGFKNAAVDALIDKQKSIFDVATRHGICREIDALLFKEYPYVLLWNTDTTRLLYWNKFGVPPTVLGKYSRESTDYWWYDEDKARELKEAMSGNVPLAPEESEIYFDKRFVSHEGR